MLATGHGAAKAMRFALGGAAKRYIGGSKQGSENAGELTIRSVPATECGAACNRCTKSSIVTPSFESSDSNKLSIMQTSCGQGKQQSAGKC